MKVVLIQKGQLDNQNPNFCMGWHGFYLMDNINQLGTLCQIGMAMYFMISYSFKYSDISNINVNQITSDKNDRKAFNSTMWE